jgi:hypothetical protein
MNPLLGSAGSFLSGIPGTSKQQNEFIESLLTGAYIRLNAIRPTIPELPRMVGHVMDHKQLLF